MLSASASPAAAHGSAMVEATNYSSTVTSSGDPTLRWRILGGDALIELTNHSDRAVEVIGYQGEPFLRFVPGDGVYENAASPTVYLSRDRYGRSEVPDRATPDAAPEWRKVTGGASRAWHDHRAHWMSEQDPPQVAAARGQRHLVLEWYIPVRLGPPDQPRQVVASGELWWEPPHRWWPPVLTTAAAWLLVIGLAARRSRPSSDAWPRLAHATIAILLIVTTLNVVRAVDDVAAARAPLSEDLVFIGLTVAALTAVVALTRAGRAGRPRSFAALGGAALLAAVTLVGESSDQLTASQLVTTLPPWIRRWTIAATYTSVAAVYLAVLLAFRHFGSDSADAVEVRR